MYELHFFGAVSNGRATGSVSGAVAGFYASAIPESAPVLEVGALQFTAKWWGVDKDTGLCRMLFFKDDLEIPLAQAQVPVTLSLDLTDGCVVFYK